MFYTNLKSFKQFITLNHQHMFSGYWWNKKLNNLTYYHLMFSLLLRPKPTWLKTIIVCQMVPVSNYVSEFEFHRRQLYLSSRFQEPVSNRWQMSVIYRGLDLKEKRTLNTYHERNYFNTNKVLIIIGFHANFVGKPYCFSRSVWVKSLFNNENTLP